MPNRGQFDRTFPTDDACKEYIVRKRWPKGVSCPRCGAKEKVYALKSKPFSWTCCNKGCGERRGYRFSVTTGTIFQDTKVSLRIWFKIGYLMITAKKGLSSLQVRRVIFGENSGTDWRTAWHICHRWRAAMQGNVLPLTGEVEIDETFVGGKAHNTHAKQRKAAALTGIKGKVAVIGAIARKAMVVAKVIENTDTKTLDGFVRKTVAQNVKLVATEPERLCRSDYDVRSLAPANIPALKYSGGFHKAHGPTGPQKARLKREAARQRRGSVAELVEK
ncbi:MAG: IS1595 family transposase [Candidatus Binataceae bacterium]